MTRQASKAYACVAYRIMEYEGNEVSEEYLEILLELLYDFYSEQEINGIYEGHIRLDSYEAAIGTCEIKQQISV